jgi:hypothetical protein
MVALLALLECLLGNTRQTLFALRNAAALVLRCERRHRCWRSCGGAIVRASVEPALTLRSG